MTYKEIAKLAHVSLSTVSKALSSSSEVSEELRERIVKIAIEQGYFAEKGKRKIEYARKSSITIAILCPEIISIAYAGQITAIIDELEKRGAVAAIYVYNFDLEKLRRIIKEITVGNRADGIIIFDSIPTVSDNSIPMVGIGTGKGNYDTVSVSMDDCFFEIIGYLKECGHKEIAYVGEMHTPSKYKSYKCALEKHGMSYDDENVFIVNERFEDIGYIAAERMIQKSKFPDAAVCAYDEIALALIRALTEYGRKIPEDISIVGINDIPMAAYSTIPLTTVKIFNEEQAQTVVGLLYDKIFGKDATTNHYITRHKLIIRNSTGKGTK